MKIISKLTLGFMFISILVGFLAYMGYNATISIKNEYDRVAFETVPVLESLNSIRLSGIGIIDTTKELVALSSQDKIMKIEDNEELAEANKPVDAFELARNNFPIIGFSSNEDLRKDFEIELLKEQGADFIGLHLKVKPNSIYKDNYSFVDFWIDGKLNLPAKVIAVSTDGDIYEIRFVQPKVNERIDKKVFEVKIPEGFGRPEVIPLGKARRK